MRTATGDRRAPRKRRCSCPACAGEQQGAADTQAGAHSAGAYHHSRESGAVPLAIRQPVDGAAARVGLAEGRGAPLAIQRQPADGSVASPAPPIPAPAPAATQDAGGPDTTAAANTKPATALIVDNGQETLLPGQMRKSDFIAQLRAALCATADEALAGTIWSAAGCPWIDQWLGYYGGQSAAHGEDAIRRYAPEAAVATTAQGYIAPICSRVRTGIGNWLATGKLSDVPSGVSPDLPVTPPPGPAVQQKSVEGAGASTASPASILASLGPGRPLDGGVAGRIGSTLGVDSARVRVHTDTRAATLSEQLSARAFTVGSHIAFRPGEYQPGTPIGDALIAHEMAHVAQQSGGAVPAQPSQAEYGALEEAADRSAADAVVSAWATPGSSLAGLARAGIARVKSGLRLQRCDILDSCKDKPKSLEDRFKEMTTESDLGPALQNLEQADLDKLAKVAPPGSLLETGLKWETLFRGSKWQDLLKLHQADTAHEFYKAYADRIVEAIMADKTCVHVVSTDKTFRASIENDLRTLVGGRAGTLLLLGLLAAGQTVNIAQTSGDIETKRQKIKGVQEPGVFVTSDAQGNVLPSAQQHAGTPTGSDIAFNPDLAANEASLTGTAGSLKIEQLDPAISLGHELIHALHSARGENISPPDIPGFSGMFPDLGKVKNPVTGEAQNPEELRTITGATSFTSPSGLPAKVPWALDYNLPGADNVTENMLRAEHGMPARVSHTGATRAFKVPVPKGETLTHMLGRYSLKSGGSISPALQAVIRAQFLEFNPYFADPTHTDAPVAIVLDFPHGSYLWLYLSMVAVPPDPAMAQVAADLTVTGATNP